LASIPPEWVIHILPADDVLDVTSFRITVFFTDKELEVTTVRPLISLRISPKVYGQRRHLHLLYATPSAINLPVV
jgi:hypothetical protein